MPSAIGATSANMTMRPPTPRFSVCTGGAHVSQLEPVVCAMRGSIPWAC